MGHRQLPHELRERVRRFVHYKWLATRGVDEESILSALPTDLRRDIKRHLCLDLVRRVNQLTAFAFSFFFGQQHS
jgi:cyclic nucleotide gated channel, plant